MEDIDENIYLRQVIAINVTMNKKKIPQTSQQKRYWSLWSNIFRKVADLDGQKVANNY